MAKIGCFNVLKVLRVTTSGYFLDGEELGDILLPGNNIPAVLSVDDQIEVFIYFDSEDRIIATTDDPYCEVGEFALLEVVEVNAVGAFLNWGLQKDLLVPFREQKVKMEPGSWHIVHVYLDEQTNRIAASAKVDKFLGKEPAVFQPGEEVELFIYGPCPLGYNAIINNAHWGMLYSGEVFQPLNRGEHIKAYINKVREDGKIDLNLSPPGYKKAGTSAELIVEYLERNHGFMKLTDKSPADDIYETFGISKKNFKMAIGSLYKNRVIEIGENGIRLVK
ncbi:MAG: S1-like domain-containing RNA-binding protein [Bacteroidota bacterium]